MMSDDQIAALFERWLALTDAEQRTVFPRMFGRMEVMRSVGDPKTPQYIQATAFFELVEQYIADCETNTDNEA
jgi:hypothetical protein